MKYSYENKPLYCPQTTSQWYKGAKPMKVLGVLWHSTGANNPNLWRYVQPSDNAPDRAYWLKMLGENRYHTDWNHTNRKAGVNAWIGRLADGTVAAVQSGPWDMAPWGCGDGKRGSCNNGWIQFEICEDDLTDPVYFKKAYREAVELTAYLCRMYGLDPMGNVRFRGVDVPVILCHKDSYQLELGSNHGDVYNWFNRYGKTMQDVRKDVAELLEEDEMTGEEIYNRLNEYLKNQPAPEWAKAELQEAVDLGITDGSRPMQFIPRYQAAIMAKRAAGK